MQEFVPGPDAASIPDAPPKRGPGRPKGSRNKPRTGTEQAPRRGRPPGSGSAYRSRKEDIGGILTIVSMVMQASPLRNDALDALEIDALATAIDAEARRNPTFRRYVIKALGMTSGAGGIGAIVGIIIVRRMARHGLAPVEFDAQAAMLLQLASNSNAEATVPPPPAEPIPFPSS